MTSSSSYPPIHIDIRSTLASTLQASIQNNLAARGWADPTDPMMAEYILVMLANAKERDQIDQELSELLGEGVYDNAFTRWVWDEATRTVDPERVNPAGSSDAAAVATSALEHPPRSPPQQRIRTRSPDDHRGSQSNSRHQRRNDEQSLSPGFRRSASPVARSSRLGGKAADHWEPRIHRNEVGETRVRRGQQRRQQHSQSHRPPRELFASARASLQDSASRLSPSVSADPGNDEVMQEGHLQDSPTRVTEMQIRGSAHPQGNNTGRELFARSINAASAPTTKSKSIPKGPRRTNQATPANPNAGLSLLARAGIPDPRAPTFVPNAPYQAQPFQPSPSLTSRLDPMLPNNAPLPQASISMAEQTIPSADFPTKPVQASLCRYASACTNPLCEYSHPSPRSSVAKRKGEIKDEPILTSSTPCRFGYECTKVECTYSHVSPAVFFLSAKIERTGASASEVGIGRSNGTNNNNNNIATASSSSSSAETTSIPCRFGDKCNNASCAYMHVDAATGRVVPSPALVRILRPATSGSSSSSSQASQQVNGRGREREGTVHGDSPMHTDMHMHVDMDMGEKGPDGKPLALDRPLKDSTSHTNGTAAGAGTGAGAAGSATGGGVKPKACRFGQTCTRVGCWFSHPPSSSTTTTLNAEGDGDANGDLSKSSHTRTRTHISDRLSRFIEQESNEVGERERERIIPC